MQASGLFIQAISWWLEERIWIAQAAKDSRFESGGRASWLSPDMAGDEKKRPKLSAKPRVPFHMAMPPCAERRGRVIICPGW
jgi:hypothetical protein